MTHKKLILMALMGVMLSDAEAGIRRSSRKKNAVAALKTIVTQPPKVKTGGGEKELIDDIDKTIKNEAMKNEIMDVINLSDETKQSLGSDSKEKAFEPYDFFSMMTNGASEKAQTKSGIKGKLSAYAGMIDSFDAVKDVLPSQKAFNIINRLKTINKIDRVAGQTAFAHQADGKLILAQNAHAEHAGLLKFGAVDIEKLTLEGLGNPKDRKVEKDVLEVVDHLETQYEKFVEELNKTKLIDAQGQVRDDVIKVDKLGLGNDYSNIDDGEHSARNAKTTLSKINNKLADIYHKAVAQFSEQIGKAAQEQKLFLPVVTQPNSNDGLDAGAAAFDADAAGFSAKSNTDGITVGQGYTFRLIPLRKGAKTILDSEEFKIGRDRLDIGYTAGKLGAKAGAKLLRDIITEKGAKVFKEASKRWDALPKIDREKGYDEPKFISDLNKLLNDSKLLKDMFKKMSAVAANKNMPAQDKRDEQEKLTKGVLEVVKVEATKSLGQQGLYKMVRSMKQDEEAL